MRSDDVHCSEWIQQDQKCVDGHNACNGLHSMRIRPLYRQFRLYVYGESVLLLAVACLDCRKYRRFDDDK